MLFVHLLRDDFQAINPNSWDIIPVNMSDGILLIKGKRLEDWNYSGPHGAGRLYSRRMAKQSIGINDFRESMKGIHSSKVDIEHLDEAKQAYRDIDYLLQQISPIVEEYKVIKPIYNWKQ